MAFELRLKWSQRDLKNGEYKMLTMQSAVRRKRERNREEKGGNQRKGKSLTKVSVCMHARSKIKKEMRERMLS